MGPWSSSIALGCALLALPVACGAASPREQDVACADAAAKAGPPIETPDDPGFDAIADASSVCEDACAKSGTGASCRVLGDLQDKFLYAPESGQREKIQRYSTACSLRDVIACAQIQRWEAASHAPSEQARSSQDTAARAGDAPASTASTTPSSPPAPGSGTSLSVEDMNVDGLVIRRMQCNVGSTGLLGPIVIGGIIASKREALAGCGKADVVLAWSARGGKVTTVHASGVPDAQARCVERVAKQMAGLPDGDCTTEIAAGGKPAPTRSAP